MTSEPARLLAITPGHLTPGADPATLVATLGALLRGGVRLVQLREKALQAEDLQRLWQALGAHRADFPDTRWLINPGPAIALTELAGLPGLGGVHLSEARAGELTQARRRFGSQALLGRAVHDLQGARTAAAGGADLLICSPVFATPSKPGAAALGLAALARIVAAVRPMPVYALGGMTPANAQRCREQTGAYGVAALSGLFGAPDPAQAARKFLTAL